jgi:hypothetical protein
MKKVSAFRYAMLCTIICLVTLSSCEKEKELRKRPFKASTKTWYRISPTTPAPVTIEGKQYFTFAYVPGGGEGNATHIGKIKTWFNQLSFTSSDLPIPEGSLVAPVVDAIDYPVTGAPLPLIQAGDFAELARVSAALHLPQSVHGYVISSFLYNEKGDAVFLSNTGVSTATTVSPTRIEFGGKSVIVGGRGKFKNAVGEVDFTGYFNPNDPSEAEYGVDGWIAY